MRKECQTKQKRNQGRNVLGDGLTGQGWRVDAARSGLVAAVGDAAFTPPPLPSTGEAPSPCSASYVAVNGGAIGGGGGGARRTGLPLSTALTRSTAA